MKRYLRLVIWAGLSVAGLGATAGASGQLLPLPADATAETPAFGGKLPAWDVVSVKEHKKDDGTMRWGQSADGMTFTNLPLEMVLQQAYEMHNTTDDAVTGLPGWAKSVRFDIDAKVSAEDVEMYKKLNRAQHAEMLRTLLEERFGLKAHKVTTDAPVYALVVAKGGAKLTAAAPETLNAEGKPINGGRWTTRDGGIDATDSTLATLVSMLTQSSGRTVVDRTGLTGKYDYKLTWTPDAEADAGADNGKAAAPPLFTAVQEQLGLKLEASRGQVEGLVIDKVEMPSAN